MMARSAHRRPLRWVCLFLAFVGGHLVCCTGPPSNRTGDPGCAILSGDSSAGSVSHGVVARVDGHPIGEESLTRALQALPEALRSGLEFPEQRTKLVDQLINRRLLYRAGLKDPALLADAAFRAHLREYLEREVSRAYLDRKVKEATGSYRATEDEIRAYYQAHQAEFRTPERIQVGRILLRADGDPKRTAAGRERLQSLRGRILRGESFAALALAHGEGSEKKSGGVMGWYDAGGQMPSPLVAARSLGTGAVSEVLAAPGGLCLLTVLDRTEARQRPVAEVSQEIAGILTQKREIEAVRALTERLRSGATIEIDGSVVEKVSARVMAKP